MLVDKNTYVRIRKHILRPGERSENIPEDTAKVPLKMWVKGRLCHEAELFEEAKIMTVTGRIVEGTLKEVEPRYKHGYGDFVDEVFQMRQRILNEMWGDSDE